MVQNGGDWITHSDKNARPFHLELIQLLLLSKARTQKLEAKQIINNGLDPSSLRKAEKQQISYDNVQEQRFADGLPMMGSFEDIAREWGQLNVNGWDEKNPLCQHTYRL